MTPPCLMVGRTNCARRSTRRHRETDPSAEAVNLSSASTVLWYSNKKIRCAFLARQTDKRSWLVQRLIVPG